MGLLDGRRALVFGVANDHSIAWGIAKAFHDQGATVGFSSVECLIERRVRPLAESIGATFVEPCDVQSDDQIAGVMDNGTTPMARSTSWSTPSPTRSARTSTAVRRHVARRVRARPGRVRVLAGRADARPRPFLHRGLVRADAELLRRREGRDPYNVMGVAKAALEASVRYLAADLGPTGIRVNAISAGPIRTLSAAGIAASAALRPVRRDRADPLAHHDRGRRQHRAVPRLRPVERGHRRGRLRGRRLQHHGRALPGLTAVRLLDRPPVARPTRRLSPARPFIGPTILSVTHPP